MMAKAVKKILALLLAVMTAVTAMPIQAQAAPGRGAGYVIPFEYVSEPQTYVSSQNVLLNGIYFTVDTYNDRIIYNDTPDPTLGILSWKVMADDLNKPHSICSDGLIYLVTDTDNNRVVTYARLFTGEFVEVQSFESVGVRPHYCVYDAATSSFYVWSSYTGEMYIYKRNKDFTIRLVSVKKIDALRGLYTRSFTIDGNKILLCSQGAGGIIVVDKRTFRITAAYPVPDEIGGVVQVSHVGAHYYLTTSSDRYGNMNSAKVVRSDSLAGFMFPSYYTDVTAELGGSTGLLVPYYITEAYGMYFVRFIGMGAGQHDCGCWFNEDIFGNIVVYGTIS